MSHKTDPFGISQEMPCAAGLLWRIKTWPAGFRQCGSNVTFGRNIRIVGATRIAIGKNVIIDDNCTIDAGEAGEISIDDGAYIGRNTKLECNAGSIFIGHSANLSANCTLTSSNRIVVGRGTMIAGFTRIDSCLTKPTIIGNDCWFGAHVTIEAGSILGDRVIAGAGAVIRGNVANGQKIVGNHSA